MPNFYSGFSGWRFLRRHRPSSSTYDLPVQPGALVAGAAMSAVDILAERWVSLSNSRAIVLSLRKSTAWNMTLPSWNTTINRHRSNSIITVLLANASHPCIRRISLFCGETEQTGWSARRKKSFAVWRNSLLIVMYLGMAIGAVHRERTMHVRSAWITRYALRKRSTGFSKQISYFWKTTLTEKLTWPAKHLNLSSRKYLH